MKFLLKPIAVVIVAIMLFNCSVESMDYRLNTENHENSIVSTDFTCSSGICGARLTNNGTLSVDLTIYDHNDILLFEELLYF